MKLHVLSALVLGSLLASAAPSTPAPGSPMPHCQVPCGIYGDMMRIDMLREDAATIEKGMTEIQAMEDMGEVGNRNQIVRWVMTKEEHAQKIQDQVAQYWLAQRIKVPAEDSVEAQEAYRHQLEVLHGIIVKAMRCKQTNDMAHVADLRALVQDLSASYFSEEDLKHLKQHTQGR